jgi:hypothetical protein
MSGCGRRAFAIAGHLIQECRKLPKIAHDKRTACVVPERPLFARLFLSRRLPRAADTADCRFLWRQDGKILVEL